MTAKMMVKVDAQLSVAYRCYLLDPPCIQNRLTVLKQRLGFASYISLFNKAKKALGTTYNSDAHRDMVLSMTRLHLQSCLLKRFGTFKQMECRIIGTPQFSVVLNEWAKHLVQQSPENPHINAYEFPNEVLKSYAVQGSMASPEVSWLIERIRMDSKFDCVPQPHFPSVLKLEVPQWPFHSDEIDRMRKYYGLLKWPFRHPSSIRKPRDQKRAAVESRSLDSRLQAISKNRLSTVSNVEDTETGCNTQYIYAPISTVEHHPA